MIEHHKNNTYYATITELGTFLEQVTRQRVSWLVNGVLSLVLFKDVSSICKKIIQQWLIIHTVTFTQTALFF